MQRTVSRPLQLVARKERSPHGGPGWYSTYTWILAPSTNAAIALPPGPSPNPNPASMYNLGWGCRGVNKLFASAAEAATTDTTTVTNTGTNTGTVAGVAEGGFPLAASHARKRGYYVVELAVDRRQVAAKRAHVSPEGVQHT